MLRSLFGRGKKRPPAAQLPGNTIRAAQVGDVLVVQGLALEYDHLYFVVENIHRYGGNRLSWFELEVADAEHRLWLEWQEEGDGLFITATDDRRPVTLEALGLTEADLITLDEEHSLGNNISVAGRRFFYRNSFEAFYFRNNQGQGQGFYLWDFLAEDEARSLSIVKYEGAPYEAHFSETLSPENVILYPGARPEQRKR